MLLTEEARNKTKLLLSTMMKKIVLKMNIDTSFPLRFQLIVP